MVRKTFWQGNQWERVHDLTCFNEKETKTNRSAGENQQCLNGSEQHGGAWNSNRQLVKRGMTSKSAKSGGFCSDLNRRGRQLCLGHCAGSDSCGKCLQHLLLRGCSSNYNWIWDFSHGYIHQSQLHPQVLHPTTSIDSLMVRPSWCITDLLGSATNSIGK